MEFRRLTLKDIPRVRPFFRFAPWRTCDLTVGTMFMWRDYYGLEYCIAEETLFVRQTEEDGSHAYGVPLGPSPEGGVKRLLREAMEGRDRIEFETVPEPFLARLASCGRKIQAAENRDYADYLYSAEAMRTFAGRHLSGQRNHIKHFERDHGEIRFAELTGENMQDAKDFFRDVYREAPGAGSFEREESESTREVLDHFEEYGMMGGILYADGQVAGFSMAEQVGDTLFVHIEKSRKNCDGCYQMLTRSFARHFCDDSVRFVNREDDMGDEGLRYSKLAYHPVELLKKYRVTLFP